MTKHISIKIFGKVHGIGFRFSAYEKFVELGLVGKAENSPDNAIIVEAEGEEPMLDELIKWCHEGPSGAKIENVEVSELAEPFVPLKMG
jgi:acylphosphatase